MTADYDLIKIFRFAVLGINLTLFHMGGGADSALLQIVFFITSIRDAEEPRNLVISPKM